jgi:hypothetical protein
MTITNVSSARTFETEIEVLFEEARNRRRRRRALLAGAAVFLLGSLAVIVLGVTGGGHSSIGSLHPVAGGGATTHSPLPPPHSATPSRPSRCAGSPIALPARSRTTGASLLPCYMFPVLPSGLKVVHPYP